MLGNGLQPAALEYLDATTLGFVAGACPVAIPAGAGFALLAEVDGAADEARRQRDELVAVLAEGALAVAEPRAGRRLALARRRRGAVAAVRGGKASRGHRRAAATACDEAIAAIGAIGAATAWRPAAGVTPGTATSTPASSSIHDRAGARERAIATHEPSPSPSTSAAPSPASTASAISRRGQLERQWDPGAIRAHEAIKAALDPKGLLNPGKKVARA